MFKTTKNNTPRDVIQAALAPLKMDLLKISEETRAGIDAVRAMNASSVELLASAKEVHRTNVGLSDRAAALELKLFELSVRVVVLENERKAL